MHIPARPASNIRPHGRRSPEPHRFLRLPPPLPHAYHVPTVLDSPDGDDEDDGDKQPTSGPSPTLATDLAPLLPCVHDRNHLTDQNDEN